MHDLLHWLAVHTGSDHRAGASVYYNFWSGFGSDLGELTIVGGLGVMWRRHNCGVKGCWRLARRPVPGTAHVVCHRHHPCEAPTAEDVIEDHCNAQADQ